jgi:inositol transport system ATP-binding protein
LEEHPLADQPCLLEVRNLSKSFPGVQALQDVCLDVRPATVHALMGENGAGKSTLLKALIGIHAPQGGQILWKGRPVRIRNPHEALRLGISMIHQELLPLPDLTVAENVCIGQEPTRWLPGWLDKPAMNRRTQELLGRLGVRLSPTRKMRELSVAEMQTVEIAKALAHHAELIIMDEPTSAISQREVDALLGLIGDLKRRGVAVIYVSHKMDEVFRVADAITVLRDGRRVATHEAKELDRNRLIALMVGRELASVANRSDVVPKAGDVVLDVQGLTQVGKFRAVSFQVRRGEVLGIAGLMGAGRTELVSAIFGLARADAGEIRVDGRPVRIASPRDAIAHGIALVAEDRKRYGLVPEMSVKHNLTLASLRRCAHGPLIDHRKENRLADEQIRVFSIKTHGRNQRASGLSGGTQQKIVVAKALLTNPAILILDEPTRGIDIGAKAEIYAIIGRLASQGKAIVMVSSELPEILAISHRILVMCEGAVTAELDPQRTAQEEILKHAMPN